MVYQRRAQQRTPRLELIEPGSAVAIDCEGVLLADEIGWKKNGCGRVSIVNEHEEVVYDTFAHYGRHVNHRPQPQRLALGVKYKDIMPKHGALYIDQVVRDVTRILDRAGVVVGHALIHDRQMLRDVPWERYETRDTQQYLWNQTDRKGLSDVAYAVLGRSIQGGEHSSVDDAQATMALFLVHRNRSVPADLHDFSISSGSDSASAAENSSGLSFETPATVLSEEDEVTTQALQAHRASIPRWVAPGHLVALPNIKGMLKGRKFDAVTSTYYLVLSKNASGGVERGGVLIRIKGPQYTIEMMRESAVHGEAESPLSAIVNAMRWDDERLVG